MTQKRKSMTKKIVLAGVLVVLLAILLAQNTEVVTYRFFFWPVRVPQVILAPLLAAAGFLLGYLVAALKKRRKPGEP
jgi:uncharacterized integral membrane protein